MYKFVLLSLIMYCYGLTVPEDATLHKLLGRKDPEHYEDAASVLGRHRRQVSSTGLPATGSPSINPGSPATNPGSPGVGSEIWEINDAANLFYCGQTGCAEVNKISVPKHDYDCQIDSLFIYYALKNYVTKVETTGKGYIVATKAKIEFAEVKSLCKYVRR